MQDTNEIIVELANEFIKKAVDRGLTHQEALRCVYAVRKAIDKAVGRTQVREQTITVEDLCH